MTTVTNNIQIKAIAAVFSLAIVVAGIARVSAAAFNDTTDNGSNTFEAGDVTITDDDAGNVMFAMSGMAPGATATRCINVTYSGSLAADVKLFGSDTAGGLEDFLELTIERSTGAAGGATADCTGFVVAGATSVWTPVDGTIGDFTAAHTDFATGVDSRAVAAAPPNDTVSYRFTVTLQDNNSAQGLSTGVTFTWQATNS